ncbi:carboxymuconolactone decarboxylase family protein [Actinokineospora iranica]|uniref:Alkylhydroperoxidase AhpD family core domain-containing protein n=1 Tax=Actinokineospora iranica TaxID=1271860 RepID=A0A1G6U9S3_9PSEU|nr:carboxymuconolactone decarboxylase family protein [Actinokineospora iranica]SDD38039.1 alkylhydroperoxidase AhpD family core domain-containing protein [Actinokineospora iranica]
MAEAGPGTRKFRLAVDKLTPHLMEAFEQLDELSEKVSLPLPLLELVRLRVSQINGCAYCVDSHNTDAREAEIPERHIAALPVWRAAPFFSERERAALELAEALTNMNNAPVTDEQWRSAAEHFSKVELAELTWTVSVITVWNQIAGGARPWLIS